jgi:hypothetical protein
MNEREKLVIMLSLRILDLLKREEEKKRKRKTLMRKMKVEE